MRFLMGNESMADNVAPKDQDMLKQVQEQVNQIEQLQQYSIPDQLRILQASEFQGDLKTVKDFDRAVKVDFKLKPREQHIKEMQDPNTKYDLLIVGGGANGSGVVIDAASRGLKCAVIDQFDFASGTSSRSTKMAHGGIRYFEQMFFLQGDPIQSWDLLTEALHERSYFV